MPIWYVFGMTLEQYITANELTHEAFGKLVGAPQATINRYVNGKRFPTRDMICKIHEATDGKVSFADWYEPATEAAE